jgi:hypothetical protein
MWLMPGVTNTNGATSALRHTPALTTHEVCLVSVGEMPFFGVRIKLPANELLQEVRIRHSVIRIGGASSLVFEPICVIQIFALN